MSNKNEAVEQEVVDQTTVDQENTENSTVSNEDIANEESLLVDNLVSSDDLAVLQNELTVAQAKADENHELYLSARAEADNIRKRAERDVASAHKFALEKFIPELLAVKDSLELGTKAAQESVADVENEQMANFIEGSEMTITLFADTLKKFGVEIVNPHNETFNPELHQAITMLPNDELAENTIIDVVQPGYTLNGRLLRPAMVVVSKKS